ncbi:protein of unknown function (ATP-binding subunits of Clp protease and DnaK/DnaJ chaperones 6-114) (plasmid) [Magnetospirillum sp. XM-1]|nr:protein of unknown function (ATP-binding subunits of Clp protease and DnaK/DnaJ chaperones 6-114) [Magnetospirillum sp. XM-1]
MERGIPPELRNRIDRILVFGRLDPARMPAFVDKGLLGLEAQLRMTGSRLSVTDAAKARLAKEGYSADSGARPLERLIDGRIRRPAARLLIEKPLGSAELRVDHDGEAIAVSVQPIVPPEADPKAAARWTRLHAEAALEDANQARILSIATPLALTTYGAVVKSASTRIIVATPRDIASLQKAESGNPLEPGRAFAAFLAETDGDNDCWFAVPDDDRITVVPNESKALLLDQLFRSTDAAILLFDNRAYEQELVPLLRTNRLPVPSPPPSGANWRWSRPTASIRTIRRRTTRRSAASAPGPPSAPSRPRRASPSPCRTSPASTGAAWAAASTGRCRPSRRTSPMASSCRGWRSTTPASSAIPCTSRSAPSSARAARRCWPPPGCRRCTAPTPATAETRASRWGPSSPRGTTTPPSRPCWSARRSPDSTTRPSWPSTGRNGPWPTSA